MIKRSRLEIWVIISICLYSIIIWYPTRYLPYHWDSAAFFINATKYLYDHNFWPLLAPYSEFAHPPLYPALTALFWRLFSPTPLVTHLTILPFHILLLLSTYFLGKRVASVAVGVAATALVATIPFVLAELGMPYLDLASGALAAFALTLWLFHRYWWASLVLTLAVLTKNTVIIMLIPFLVTILLDPQKRHRLRAYVPLLPPLFALSGWLVYHYQITGWWLTLPGRPTVLKLTPSSFIHSLGFVAYVCFSRQYRIILTSLTLISVFWLYQKKHRQFIKLFSLDIISLLVALTSFLTIYAFTGEFIPRYSLAVLPAFTVICCHFIYSAFTRPYAHAVILITLILFISSWHPKLSPTLDLSFRNNEDLSYQDHIQVGLETARYLQANYPQSPIYGSFPQSYQLTEPWQGYVTQPLNFVDCSRYSLNPASPAGRLKPYSLVIIHPYHYTQLECQNLLRTYPHQLLKQFTHKGLWTQIYALNPALASPSARLSYPQL